MTRVGAVQIWPEWKAHTLDDVADGGLEVGVVEHDGRALAAELEQQALHVAAGDLADAAADRVEPVKLTMSTCGEATSASAGLDAAEPVTTLTTPGGKPASSKTSPHADDGERVLRRRLHDDGVAHGQGRADLAGHVRRSGSCRRDAGDDADRAPGARRRP